MRPALVQRPMRPMLVPRQLEAQQQAQQSKESEEATREKLREQLNSVLQTTETARGLVMNLGDVLFDTNKYTLKPNAQVSLAKVCDDPYAVSEPEGAGGGIHGLDRNACV